MKTSVIALLIGATSGSRAGWEGAYPEEIRPMTPGCTYNLELVEEQMKDRIAIERTLGEEVDQSVVDYASSLMCTLENVFTFSTDRNGHESVTISEWHFGSIWPLMDELETKMESYPNEWGLPDYFRNFRE